MYTVVVSVSLSPRMDVRICVVFLVLGGTFALTGKGLYCRDPDTGKLHPVNSTWRSSSFCGNYTCKLRMKSIPDVPPIREFKVSNVNLSRTKIPQTDTLSKSVQNKTDEQNRMSSILDKIISDINEGNTSAKISETTKELKKDRYLNDKEIKIISDMLHSVKKSDLEAVVDIYNLAQEIYNELDKKTSENLVEETVNEIQKAENLGIIQNHEPSKLADSSTGILKQAHDKTSYWYDPLVMYQKAKPLSDLDSEGSDMIPSFYPTRKYENVPDVPYMSFQNYGKQPFFYDLSDFQRQSSYVHSTSSLPSTPESSLTYTVTEKPPLLQSSGILATYPSGNQQVQQPVLLPFPYYNVHYNSYNSTGYPYHYYYGVNPYQDAYMKYYNSYYSSTVPKIEQENVPERSYKTGSLLDALLPKDDSNKKKLDWKTDSLSEDVIEDIRGHVEKNMLFKPLCLRKKIKLDKVGKVFKLEDINRDKRSASKDGLKMEKNDDRFEVYIERTTCHTDVDPGFFRMGNDTAPFPDCCPQRISR